MNYEPSDLSKYGFLPDPVPLWQHERPHPGDTVTLGQDIAVAERPFERYGRIVGIGHFPRILWIRKFVKGDKDYPTGEVKKHVRFTDIQPIREQRYSNE
jgi:hypothetical protein